jgi:hypothetical protein
MKTKFKVGDCVKFEAFDGSMKAGVISVIAPWRRKGKLRIGIQTNGSLYTRHDDEIYPMANDDFVLLKMENQ